MLILCSQEHAVGDSGSDRRASGSDAVLAGPIGARYAPGGHLPKGAPRAAKPRPERAKLRARRAAPRTVPRAALRARRAAPRTVPRAAPRTVPRAVPRTAPGGYPV